MVADPSATLSAACQRLWERPKPGWGRVTASQHRKRLAHDAQGGRGAGASRFRFGGKKEAAGVCRGCGEPMEIQSKLACNQQVSQGTTIAEETHSSNPYTSSMAQPSVRGACGFVLTGYTDITLAARESRLLCTIRLCSCRCWPDPALVNDPSGQLCIWF